MLLVQIILHHHFQLFQNNKNTYKWETIKMNHLNPAGGFYHF